MTEHDTIDQRLREYAGRWRTAEPSPSAVPLDRFAPRHASRAWWVAGLTAAAVAAGVALGSVLIGQGDTNPSKPTHTARPSDVVPWAPLPATSPQIPTTTTPPSPDPADAAGKPECRATQLRAENNGTDGAAGTIYLVVRLVLVGTSPCRLEDWPDVEPMDIGRRVDIPLRRWTGGPVHREPVLVAPGRPAVLVLTWLQNWCTTPVHNDSFRLLLPGGSVDFPGFGSSPYCNGIAGSGPTPIMVQPFKPEKSRPARVRSIYADVHVDGDLQLTSAPKKDVHFTVTLTSPRDLTLEPCPDYRIAEFGGDRPWDNTYGLNCDAVPYRDAAGRPYLPAGTPVRFDMVAHVGDRTVPKLVWELGVPELQKALGGQITVTGSTESGTPDPQPTEHAAEIRAGTRAIQGFLDSWRRDGLFVAARTYVEPGSRPAGDVGLPHLAAGRVLHAELFSWQSADHFTLEVSLDLHFSGDRMAWDEGENDRFVTVTRDGGRSLLEFATSP